jgi:hypothetical protein
MGAVHEVSPKAGNDCSRRLTGSRRRLATEEPLRALDQKEPLRALDKESR